MGGRLFWRLKTTSNDLDPDFNRQSLRLRRFFLPNFGDLQKKRKKSSVRFRRLFCSNLDDLQKERKKRSSARLKSSFSVRNSGPWPLLIANANGRIIFAFRPKIGIKSAEKVVFCKLFRPMGGYSPHPSWLRYWAWGWIPSLLLR